MRNLLIACSVFFLISAPVFAQGRSGFVNTPGVTRAFGSVVFPGGSSALPGVQRTTGSVVFPGGGGPQIGVPAIPQQGLGFTQFTTRNGRPGIGAFGQGGFGRGKQRHHEKGVYAYPWLGSYYGGYYGGDLSSYDNGYSQPDDNGYAQVPPPQMQAQQPPQVVVIYPPASSANPVTIYPSEPGNPQTVPPSGSLYPPPASRAVGPADSGDEATHYLIAFKDHTIYSAVAYWVDGDTLHYFTSGNTHNQVSLSLVDRAMTAKLNKDSGLEVKLPPAN